MKPTVGRIVHYNNGGQLQAAIIIKVHNDECINLVTWNEYGTSSSFTSVVRGGDNGRWDWPAKI